MRPILAADVLQDKIFEGGVSKNGLTVVIKNKFWKLRRGPDLGKKFSMTDGTFTNFFLAK